MNHWLDQTLVGIVLMISAGYALMNLGPRALRKRILALVGRAAASAPRSMRLTPLALKLAAAAAIKPKGSCGGCEDCGTGADSTTHSAPTEIKIPVGKIGRRA